MTGVVFNGNAYSDDGSAARDMRQGGHRAWLLPMMSDAVLEVSNISLSAQNFALSAQASAELAAINASISNRIYTISGNYSVKGTVQKLITFIEIQAGEYTTFSCFLGCTTETDTAKIELKDPEGAVILAVQKTGTVGFVSTMAIDFLENKIVGIFLTASSSSGTAVVCGIKLE